MKIDKIKKYNHLYLLMSSNGNGWFLCSDKPIRAEKLQKIADEERIGSNIYLDDIEEPLKKAGYDVKIFDPDILSVE